MAGCMVPRGGVGTHTSDLLQTFGCAKKREKISGKTMTIDNKTAGDYSAHRCYKHPKQKRIAPRPSVVVFLRPLFSMAECEANKIAACREYARRLLPVCNTWPPIAPVDSLQRSRNMTKPKSAQSGHLAVVEQTPINEATDRLSLASSALDGFVFLLSGYDNMAALKAGQLACLLEPIRMEVAAALDELRSVGGVAQ